MTTRLTGQAEPCYSTAVMKMPRVKNLRTLVRRAAKHGVGTYLYLNEPRALPLAFYETHPDFKGVVHGGYATLHFGGK